MFADAFFKGCPIAAGEISATYGAIEDEVAAKEDASFGTVKNTVTGAMTGRVANLKGEVADFENLSVREKSRFWTRINVKSVFLCAAAILP